MIRKPDIKPVHAKCILFCVLMIGMHPLFAVNRVSVSSGDWNNSSNWNPSGIPSSGDDITIGYGDTLDITSDHFVHAITVDQGGVLTWKTQNTLTITGPLTINGSVDMNGGNIDVSSPGTIFTLGSNATFTWEPGNNTLPGATLFTNCTEFFAPTSTLVINKWYDYTVPLASSINGNFGNLVLNSLTASNTIAEWNQNNFFQSHHIQGTLTVNKGWITLDKSGSITNTFIGHVILNSVNSTLYCHNGSHPASFIVATNSIINNGGNFYGLNDGNGNITLNIAGDFTNIGNVKIINNTGLAGVSNGNAVLNVGGTFSQNTGDTRIIYNISTTNSGVFNATFGNLILNGGIFMGQTACHTSGGISSMIVNNNFNLSFANVTDKFRGTSLTSIGSSVNNVKFNLTIGGNLSVTGNSTAEFTSTASSGNETISINGNVLINGMSNSFNYGTPSAAHDMVLTIGGDLIISGGSTFLSHNSGNTSVNITGNTTMQAGTFSLKGDSGNALLLFNGNFLQNGGIFYLHNNPAIATSNPLSMTVNGDFIQSSGTINFDNNQSVQSATHSINIAGSNYTLSGNGLITHASAGTGTIFGRINYLTNGTINYILTSPNHLLEQIKQTVRNGTTVSIISGNIQVASSVIPATDFFEIYPGGTVNANNGQFYSIGSGIHSCIKVDSGGILKTARTSGLYNNTSGACINASGQLDYYLDPSSIIEYNGINNQVITGVPASVPNTDNHKYGILRVNFQGTDDIEYTSLTQNVYIRTKLELAHGELNLHGNKLTIESGNPSAITRNIGYIKSETNTSANTSILSWKYLAAGHYIFPFGTNSSSYIPVEFEPVSGFGGEVSISTRATTGTDNQPVPAVSNTEKPIKLIVGGEDISRTGILDRWWNIKADGYTANVTVHYRGIENTLKDNNCCGIMNIISLNDNTWSLLSGNGAGTTASTGNITATNVTQFSNWMIASNSTPLPFKVNDFEVNPEGTQVHIVWKHSFEPTNNYFNVERSDDGNNFESIEQIKGNANADLSPDYSALDKSPFEGTSYYRLRATNHDGRIMYSDIKTINFQTGINDQLKIKDFGPNPFENNLRVTYEVNQPGPVEFQLTSSQGQIISAEKIMALKGINRYDFINKGKLTTGIYLLNITFNNKTIVKKLMRK